MYISMIMNFKKYFKFNQIITSIILHSHVRLTKRSCQVDKEILSHFLAATS